MGAYHLGIMERTRALESYWPTYKSQLYCLKKICDLEISYNNWTSVSLWKLGITTASLQNCWEVKHEIMCSIQNTTGTIFMVIGDGRLVNTPILRFPNSINSIMKAFSASFSLVHLWDDLPTLYNFIWSLEEKGSLPEISLEVKTGLTSQPSPCNAVTSCLTLGPLENPVFSLPISVSLP